MFVKSITVKGFRNLETQSVRFSEGVNVLLGSNAQGKTNILESICLCSWGKSPRTDKEKEMINFTGEAATVKAEFKSFPGNGSVEMKLSRKEKKRILLNEMPVQKIGEILGYLNVIFFSPDELKIIKQSPQERRRFLDIDLCQLDKNYYYSLTLYNKALLQRNNLLKKYQDTNTLKDVLSVWDKQLVREGVKIVCKRKEFCRLLAPLSQESHAVITSGNELFELEYQTDLKGTDAAEMMESFSAALEKDVEKQQKLGFTSVGPHRDDVRFAVEGTDIRSFGSQGQQRTAALALKFAEAELFNQLTKDYPVLLLDDVLSELDGQRQKRLFAFSDKLQVIVTTAQEHEVMRKKDVCLIKVNAGRASAK